MERGAFGEDENTSNFFLSRFISAASHNYSKHFLYIYGYLKYLVYTSYSLPDLRQKIEQNIKNIEPETIKNV